MAKKTNTKTETTARQNLHRALMYGADQVNVLEGAEEYAEKLEQIMEDHAGQICEAITGTDPEELRAAAERGEVPEEIDAAAYSIMRAAAELGFLTGYDLATRLSSNT